MTTLMALVREAATLATVSHPQTATAKFHDGRDNL